MTKIQLIHSESMAFGALEDLEPQGSRPLCLVGNLATQLAVN